MHPEKVYYLRKQQKKNTCLALMYTAPRAEVLRLTRARTSSPAQTYTISQVHARYRSRSPTPVPGAHARTPTLTLAYIFPLAQETHPLCARTHCLVLMHSIHRVHVHHSRAAPVLRAHTNRVLRARTLGPTSTKIAYRVHASRTWCNTSLQTYINHLSRTHSTAVGLNILRLDSETYVPMLRGRGALLVWC